jgi:hypothetical protein
MTDEKKPPHKRKVAALDERSDHRKPHKDEFDGTSTVDAIQRAIDLAPGWAWMPQNLLEIAREIVNHSIVNGTPEGVDIEVELHDDLPNDNCCVLILTHDNITYRLVVNGWAPVVQDDAQTLLSLIEEAFQSTCLIDDLTQDMRTKRNARLVVESHRHAYDSLVSLDKLVGRITWDLRERVQDPKKWATLIPVSADLHSIIPAAWLNECVV